MARKKRGGGGGKLSRRAALALVGGGGLLAVSGTGAFDTVEGDRGFEVSTAADQSEAVLGIDNIIDRFSALVPSGDNSSESHHLLTLINNESQTLSYIEIETDSDILEIGTPNEIPANDEKEVTGTINLPEDTSFSENETVTLDITASSTSDSGSGIEVNTTREIEVAGYRPGNNYCSYPDSVPETDINPDYNRRGSMSITDERVIGNVMTTGTVDIEATGDQTCFIDGSVTAEGRSESIIEANSNTAQIYISGDVNIENGDLKIRGKNISIGGKITVDGELTINPIGRPSNITICGPANADWRYIINNNPNISVWINGTEYSPDPGNGNSNGNGNGNSNGNGNGNSNGNGNGNSNGNGN